MVSNHDSRSPFFSLLSFNYSKALISASFHHPEREPQQSRLQRNRQPSVRIGR